MLERKMVAYYRLILPLTLQLPTQTLVSMIVIIIIMYMTPRGAINFETNTLIYTQKKQKNKQTNRGYY